MTGEIVKLENPTLDYAWGSRHFIANLQGRPAPTARPEAEMWIGAHPRAPSMLAGGRSVSLIDVIERDPQAALGAADVARFGPSLPFLVKILAAGQPLSIQVHPDSEQALEGFEAENRAGIPLDDSARSYSDPRHKVELLVALERTVALCGFRAENEAMALLQSVSGPTTNELMRQARRRTEPFALAGLIAARRLALPDRKRLVDELKSFVARDGAALPEARWVSTLADLHPEDPTILAPLLLNVVTLEPTQALFIPPRTVHAYLEGAGIEVMSSSDNVLRGGLTPKFVNERELLRVADGSPRPPCILGPEEDANGARRYSLDQHRVAEFALSSHRLDSVDRTELLDPRGVATIVVCVQGRLTLHMADAGDSGPAVEIAAAEAAWIPASGTQAGERVIVRCTEDVEGAAFYSVRSGIA